MYALLLLQLAAAVLSLPSPPTTNVPTLSDEEFTLAMTIYTAGNNTRVPLKAVRNGTEQSYILIADPEGQATPVYVNTTASPNPDYVALDFRVDGSLYGLAAAQIGSVYGIVTYVWASRDRQDYGWIVGDSGSIAHKMSAANNMFLACNNTVNGEQASILAWGIYHSNGSAPTGCWSTQLSKQ